MCGRMHKIEKGIEIIGILGYTNSAETEQKPLEK
jgi:hypothetical protein